MPKILSSEFPYLVGYYGYITLPGFVVGLLFHDYIKYRNNLSALIVFPGFLVFNQGINGLLKQICKQPRPENQISNDQQDAEIDQSNQISMSDDIASDLDDEIPF